MSLSQVQICNLALHKFGDLSIASINDDTTEARACKVWWDAMRDELLYAHDWNFAIKRADLGAYLADTPAFEYDYQYTLPSDYLRVIELYDSDANWVVEGGLFLVSDDSALIRYIARITDTSKFNPMFANCLAQRLAIELAPKLSGSKEMKTSLTEELTKVLLPQAYLLNVIETNRRLSKGEQDLSQGNFSWQAEGH